MYAVVKIKNQQFRVTPDLTLQVPLMSDEVGAKLTFDEVLMMADGDDIKVGTPTVAGATVAAEVVGHGRSRKIIVFKKKPPEELPAQERAPSALHRDQDHRDQRLRPTVRQG